MLNTETLGFQNFAFNRAAELRAARNGPMPSANAHSIILWRGKALIDQDTFALVRVSADHPILTASIVSPIFLGIDDGIEVYAHDISGWEPENHTPPDPNALFDEIVERHPSTPENQIFSELRMVIMQLSAVDGELAATAKALFSWHRSHRFCAACGEQSVQQMAGWQRDCPACETPHYPRTDPVVIMLITDGNRTLLGRSPHWPEKMYSCLAGFLEPGETLEAAVAREVKEETDIDIGPVQYVASQPWPYPSSLMIGCMASATSTKIKIDPNELDDAMWVTKETLVKAFSGSDAEIVPAREGSIAGFLIRNWVKGTLSN
jgi:NAD+ diphosphatase